MHKSMSTLGVSKQGYTNYTTKQFHDCIAHPWSVCLTDDTNCVFVLCAAKFTQENNFCEALAQLQSSCTIAELFILCTATDIHIFCSNIMNNMTTH